MKDIDMSGGWQSTLTSPQNKQTLCDIFTTLNVNEVIIKIKNILLSFSSTLAK